MPLMRVRLSFGLTYLVSFMAIIVLVSLVIVPTKAQAQDNNIIINSIRRGAPALIGKPACTISVPVKLTRVHKDVSAALVVCGIWPNQTDARGFNDKTMRGFGFRQIRLSSSRNFNGVVKVDIRERPQSTVPRSNGGTAGQPARLGSAGSGNPTHWACGLSFELRGVSEPARPSKTTSTLPLKAVGAFRRIVTGRL